MDFDDEAGDFFGEDDLFGDTDAVGEDEAIEDNRYDGVKGGGKDEISDFLKKEKKETTARRKTNPLALLNERSLVGKAGIQSLKESFANYKPNAKTDPYSHLPELLKKYQHWAHVLAPRMKFEDVMSRCEQLGEKRAIKVYMAKIRMGMPLTDEDYETGSRKRRNSDDGIITTEYASDRERSPSPPPKGKNISPPPKKIEPSQPRSMFGPPTTSTPAVVPIASSISTPLTEEQRRKIAENRLKAIELRAKREAEERERIEKEKREEEEKFRENIPPEAMEDDFPTLDEDEIMAQFDDFE